LKTASSTSSFNSIRRSILIVLLAAGVFASGCGSKTVTDTGPNGQTTTRSVPNVHFPKTKFLLHAGLAFGAFHRYIQKPLRAGTFRSGAPGRKAAFVKAGAAALFVYHELKKARDAAESSDILRRKLVNPIDRVLAKIQGLGSSLKNGSASSSDITGAGGSLDSLKSTAAGAGANIKDRTAPVPGG
jgi:hypothetical protein